MAEVRIVVRVDDEGKFWWAASPDTDTHVVVIKGDQLQVVKEFSETVEPSFEYFF